MIILKYCNTKFACLPVSYSIPRGPKLETSSPSCAWCHFAVIIIHSPMVECCLSSRVLAREVDLLLSTISCGCTAAQAEMQLTILHTF